MRKEIIGLLDRPKTHEGYLYEELKDCIQVRFHYETRIHHLTLREVDEFSDSGIDHWFMGCIQSLFYRPNKYALVLKSEHQFGMDILFARLLPNNEWYAESEYDRYNEHLYSKFILNHAFSKQSQDIIERDNFIVVDSAYAEKRLCSYCSTVKAWNYPNRKHVIVLEVLKIDWERFEAINKLDLWVELFNRFKIAR
jgi:hypothetical protein